MLEVILNILPYQRVNVKEVEDRECFEHILIVSLAYHISKYIKQTICAACTQHRLWVVSHKLGFCNVHNVLLTKQMSTKDVF